MRFLSIFMAIRRFVGVFGAGFRAIFGTILVTILGAMTLAGCAFQQIEQGMTSMEGRPINAVIEKLGFPDDERVIAGKKIYIWSTSRLEEGSSRTCRVRAIPRQRRQPSYRHHCESGREGAALDVRRCTQGRLRSRQSHPRRAHVESSK